ncbi:MAG: DUF4395 domain-containing protein [Chloroflexi bacterium HGW-Chloroflexi-2]|jgi:hypothetical protein|nr:MAG: DUF4395 domain-containing protein [Chloroflexi bacterium HGW-Chloroflexi-2]
MDITKQKQKGVPFPIVTLNRAVLTFGVLVSLLTQQIWIITILFLIILPTTLFGKRFSLVYYIGNILFKKQIQISQYEDAGLQRFNNTIATTLLGFSQISFLAGQSILGWIFASMVMLASGVALLGFCIGCFLYYQFKIQRYRIFGP